MALPNFFILGAAKCGTTSLHDLLKDHPEIFLPAAKEPQFFSDDDRHARGLAAYEAEHFAGATEPARGEATPHYLAWPKVAGRIQEAIPEAGHRFIVILRDPVERAYSLYWNMVAEGVEPLSFEDALAAEQERSRDPWLARHGSLRFLYTSSGLYGRQMEQYLEHFDRERFLMLRFEDLRDDPLALARRIYVFLGVSVDFEPRTLEAANPSGLPRSRALHAFLRRPHWIKEPLKRLLPLPARQRLLSRAFAWNRRPTAYEPMAAGTERMLRAQFEPDLLLLSKLTGFDVTAWTGGA